MATAKKTQTKATESKATLAHPAFDDEFVSVDAADVKDWLDAGWKKSSDDAAIEATGRAALDPTLDPISAEPAPNVEPSEDVDA